MTAATKNVKCTPESLDEFDKLMMNEEYPPKHRPEMFARMVKGYREYQEIKNNPPEPIIKEVEVVKEVPVEMIVYVDKPKTSSTIDKNIKLKINSILTWLDKNTQYFPTNHNLEVRDKRNEIRELVCSL